MVDRSSLRVLATFWPLAITGCAAAGSGSGPEETLAAYARAVREGNESAVYALLDEETRAGVPQERVAELLTENAAELREQTVELSALAERGVNARAQVRLSNHETAVLFLEDGHWHLDGGVLGVPTLRTPQDAILALRAALVRRSLRGALRVLARQPRSEVEADIQSLLDDTADELAMEVEVLGNTARVRTTNGREIVLIREAGEWRILEL